MNLKEKEANKLLKQRIFYRKLKQAIGLTCGRILDFESTSFYEIETKLRQNGINLSFSF